jgi:hypothetical protein
LKGLFAQVPLVPVIIWLNVFVDEVNWSFDTLINHQRSTYGEKRMHSIFALEKGSERGIREVVLHFQQVNELRHSAALLDDMLEILVWVTNELVNGLLVCEHTVFLVIFEHSKVGLSRHQKTLLNDVNQAET